MTGRKENGVREHLGVMLSPGILLVVMTLLLDICCNFTSAIEATITADQVVHWGSTVTLNCTLLHNTNGDDVKADNIIWYKDNPNQPLPYSQSRFVNNMTSSLTLPSVTYEDSGIYYCALPSDGKNIFSYQSSNIVVGVLPSPPINIKCESRNMLTFWCTWQPSDGDTTHLPSHFAFEYRGVYESGTTWRSCPDYVSKGPNSCHVPALSNSGLDQTINITVTNALGSCSTSHSFNPSRSTIPNPPTNVRSEIISPREVHVRWDLPVEWEDYMARYLSYRLRLWAGDDNNDDDTTDEHQWREIPSRQLIRRGRFIRTSFHIVHNLQPGAEYYIQAASKHRYSRPRGGCWSQWSESNVVELPAITPSGTVNDLEVEVTEYRQEHNSLDRTRDVLLTWEPVPRHMQNGRITNYTISVQPRNNINTNGSIEYHSLPGDITSYQLEDLNLHKEYGIIISACNSAGCGPNATILLGNQEPIPLQPLQLRVLFLANQSLLVTWYPRNEDMINHFLLEWTQNEATDSWRPLEIPGNENQYLISSPPNPATYSLRIRAFNSVGQGSPWSRTLTVHLDGIQLSSQY